MWKGVGIVAFVGMAWGAWMVHDDKPATAAKASRLQDLLKPESTALSPDSARALQTLASANGVDTSGRAANAIDTNVIGTADTMVRDIPMSIVAADSTVLPMLAGFATQDSIVSVQSAGTIAEPEPTAVDSAPEVVAVARAPVRAAPTTTRDVVRAPAPAPSPAAARASTRPAPKPPARATARAEVRAPAKAAPKVAAAPKASARSSKPGRWTTTVARSWVIVRADPNRRSRIIASIGPNTRVQLGESRGEWRRVKAKGLQGWVEHRSFVARAPVTKKARLAAR